MRAWRGCRTFRKELRGDKVTGYRSFTQGRIPRGPGGLREEAEQEALQRGGKETAGESFLREGGSRGSGGYKEAVGLLGGS